MALPDTDKVIQELNRRFAAPLPEFYARRIIFWYDEDRDFEEKVQTGEIELADAKLIALDETNNFEIKKLLTHDDKTSNFCVYCPIMYPDEKNWLLPVQLYSEEFRADLVSIWLEEMGIENTANLRKTVKDYRLFFKTKAHRTKVANLNQKFMVDADLFQKADSSRLNDEEKDTIDTVLESYGNKEPYELRAMTHAETPWKDMRRGLGDFDNGNAVITKDAMYDYYGSL